LIVHVNSVVVYTPAQKRQFAQNVIMPLFQLRLKMVEQ